MDELPIRSWIPYKLINSQGQLQCYWLNTFDVPFKEPFFDETILKLVGYNSSKHALVESLSDLSMLAEWGSNLMSVLPSALIFHISRCGSTLISQLLSLSDKNIVLPEVPFFDDLLRLPYQDNDFSQNTTSELLNIAIQFYGQQRTGSEQHLYIKMDSWHIFFYDQLRKLYPDVPFILLYRNPAEVFDSLKRKPALHSVPGLIEPAIFGFDQSQVLTGDLDTYRLLVIEKYLQQYLEITEKDNNVLLLNYQDGPIAMMQKIADFTHIPIDNQSLELMKKRSMYHSKKPDETFSEAVTEQIPTSMGNAMLLYNKLEVKRFGQ